MSFASLFSRKGSHKNSSKINKCNAKADAKLVRAESPTRVVVATATCKETEENVSDSCPSLELASAVVTVTEKLNDEIWKDVKTNLSQLNTDEATYQQVQYSCNIDETITELEEVFALTNDSNEAHSPGPQGSKNTTANERQELITDRLCAHLDSSSVSAVKQTSARVERAVLTDKDQHPANYDEKPRETVTEDLKQPEHLLKTECSTVLPKDDHEKCSKNCDSLGRGLDFICSTSTKVNRELITKKPSYDGDDTSGKNANMNVKELLLTEEGSCESARETSPNEFATKQDHAANRSDENLEEAPVVDRPALLRGTTQLNRCFPGSTEIDSEKNELILRSCASNDEDVNKGKESESSMTGNLKNPATEVKDHRKNYSAVRQKEVLAKLNAEQDKIFAEETDKTPTGPLKNSLSNLSETREFSSPLTDLSSYGEDSMKSVVPKIDEIKRSNADSSEVRKTNFVQCIENTMIAENNCFQGNKKIDGEALIQTLDVNNPSMISTIPAGKESKNSDLEDHAVQKVSGISTTVECFSEQKDDGFEEPKEKAPLKIVLSEDVNNGETLKSENFQSNSGNNELGTEKVENEIEHLGEETSNDLLLSDEKTFISSMVSSEMRDPAVNDTVFSQNDDLAGGNSVITHDAQAVPSWKVGYLQVKLPNKSKNRGKFKVWNRRWVVIHLDEFVKDTSDRSLMVSVYLSESGTSRKHSALFWKAVTAHRTVVYRSHSRSHKFAFSISEDSDVVLHLAATFETEAQEWMTAIRNLLWPPNPVLQLQKVLNGNEFEISIIDNEFSYHAGLLGAYGILSVTSRKLILLHPQTEHVIQEWYLNTIDKLQLSPHAKEEDAYKVVTMHTGSESSTGSGQIKFYCQDSVVLLQSIASTIHKVLSMPSNAERELYRQELDELAAWITPPEPIPPAGAIDEDYYKVPRRLVRSLLDIPNFLFEKPIACEDNVLEISATKPSLPKISTWVSTFSEDSGISIAPLADDLLNCSVTSFTIGGRKVLDRSSSESSDAYSPPCSPETERKSGKATTET